MRGLSPPIAGQRRGDDAFDFVDRNRGSCATARE